MCRSCSPESPCPLDRDWTREQWSELHKARDDRLSKRQMKKASKEAKLGKSGKIKDKASGSKTPRKESGNGKSRRDSVGSVKSGNPKKVTATVTSPPEVSPALKPPEVVEDHEFSASQEDMLSQGSGTSEATHGSESREPPSQEAPASVVPPGPAPAVDLFQSNPALAASLKSFISSLQAPPQVAPQIPGEYPDGNPSGGEDPGDEGDYMDEEEMDVAYDYDEGVSDFPAPGGSNAAAFPQYPPDFPPDSSAVMRPWTESPRAPSGPVSAAPGVQAASWPPPVSQPSVSGLPSAPLPGSDPGRFAAPSRAPAALGAPPPSVPAVSGGPAPPSAVPVPGQPSWSASFSLPRVRPAFIPQPSGNPIPVLFPGKPEVAAGTFGFPMSAFSALGPLPDTQDYLGVSFEGTPLFRGPPPPGETSIPRALSPATAAPFWEKVIREAGLPVERPERPAHSSTLGFLEPLDSRSSSLSVPFIPLMDSIRSRVNEIHALQQVGRIPWLAPSLPNRDIDSDVFNTPLVPEACWERMTLDTHSQCVPMPPAPQGVQGAGPSRRPSQPFRVQAWNRTRDEGLRKVESLARDGLRANNAQLLAMAHLLRKDRPSGNSMTEEERLMTLSVVKDLAHASKDVLIKISEHSLMERRQLAAQAMNLTDKSGLIDAPLGKDLFGGAWADVADRDAANRKRRAEADGAKERGKAKRVRSRSRSRTRVPPSQAPSQPPPAVPVAAPQYAQPQPSAIPPLILYQQPQPAPVRGRSRRRRGRQNDPPRGSNRGRGGSVQQRRSGQVQPTFPSQPSHF